MCPCSPTASAIVDALVSLSELQGAFLPVNILMKVPIDALNEGPKQQGYVCMSVGTEMNELCGDVCVPGKKKIKPSDSKVCARESL